MKLRHRESVPLRVSTIEVSEFLLHGKNTIFDDLFSKKSLKSMVLQGFARTFNFWGFAGLRGSPNWKTLICGSFRNDLFSKKSIKSMVLSTFNFWGFCGPYRKTPDFNDLFWKKTLKSRVLSTFNFWGFCGPYRDFLYYSCSKQNPPTHNTSN